MSKFLKMFGIVAVLVAVVAFVGATAAFAQGPNQPDVGTPPGTGQARNGFGNGQGLAPVDQEAMHEAIAEVLGLESADELEAELAEGKTLAVLASELNVDLAEVRAAMSEVHASALQDAVESGLITQEQANWMLGRRAGQNGQGAGMNRGFGNGSGGGLGRGYGGNGGFGGECPYQTS